MASQPKPCKDCTADENLLDLAPRKPPRNAPYPGPRCYTHHKIEVKRVKAANHERTVQRTYGLSEGEYEALYLWQGGRCALCKRATGKTRRLSVDHDHQTGAVRGLLCRPCNTILGRAGDNPEFFERGAMYLRTTPYQTMRDWSTLHDNRQGTDNVPDVQASSTPDDPRSIP